PQPGADHRHRGRRRARRRGDPGRRRADRARAARDRAAGRDDRPFAAQRRRLSFGDPVAGSLPGSFSVTWTLFVLPGLMSLRPRALSLSFTVRSWPATTAIRLVLAIVLPLRATVTVATP